MNAITEFDLSVLHSLETIRNEVLTFILRVFTHLADAGIFWILLCAAMLIYPKTRKIGFYAAVALALQAILGEAILKHIVCRERPYYYEPWIDTIINRPITYSFPSGHTSSSAAVALSVFIQNRKMGAPLIVIALLVAFSRVYFMVHYPTDVICGIILGCLCAVITFFILGYILKKYHVPFITQKDR
ncbi:MAG: phosphatase PAP2 family protein [Ruminococcus sp.]|nr:phosphatase PAP2 family protein [Ruminococcus sp.]